MVSAGGIRAGRAFVEIGVRDRTVAALKRIEKRFKAVGAGIQSLGRKFLKAGASIVTPLLGAVGVFTKMGDRLDKLSARTGFSVEALSAYGFAAEQSGADLDTLEAGIRGMQRQILNADRGLSTAVDTFDELGITAGRLERMSPQEQFLLIADHLAGIEHDGRRAALAMSIFGRSGQKLVPLLSQGAEGIRAFEEEAKQLGIVIGTEEAQAAARLTDQLNILWKTVKAGVFAVGAALAPTISDLVTRLTKAAVAVGDWIRRNQALIVAALKIGGILLAVGAALVALGTLVIATGALFGGLASIVTFAGTALSTVAGLVGALISPLGVAAAAVIALGAAWLKWSSAGAAATEWLGGAFTALKERVGRVIGGIGDALAAGDLSLAARILWLGLKVEWIRGTSFLQQKWEQFSGWFVETATTAFWGAVGLISDAFSQLEVAWVETTTFLANTWTRFVSKFKSLWRSGQNFFAKGILKIMAKFDESIDLDEAMKSLQEDYERDLGRIKSEEKRTIAGREAARQQRRARIEAEREGVSDFIGEKVRAAQEARRRKSAGALAKANAKLAQAQSELSSLLSEARQKREAAGDGKGPGGLSEKIQSLFESLEATTLDRAGTKAGVVGSFSAFAGRGFGIGRSPEQRTAKATEATAEGVQRLVRQNRNQSVRWQR